jgi:hypothetical protein
LKHFLIVVAIVIAVGAVYMKVPSTYFCSYDDFNEIHRAAFEDAVDPTRIVTTPHFTPLMYRPLNRAVNFLTYRLGDVNPELYRTKNVAFHSVNVVLVYLLAWKLFRSIGISAVAALFFGLHPVANQTIIGAVHTNSMAHAGFIGAVLMLMHSLESSRHWALWLTASVFSGWLGLMAYDSTIVVFGLMLFWLLLNWDIVRGRFKNLRFMVLFFALSGSMVTFYFFLRRIYASEGLTQAASVLPAAGVMLKNTVMYMGSLLLPVDVVLANEWLNTPLPSEIQFDKLSTTVVVALLSLIGMSVGLVLLRWLSTNARGINYIAVVFIFFGIAMPLLPVLLLQSRPSETYLYLPVGFYSILLSYGLAKVLANAERSWVRSFYIPTIVVMTALFASATWVRNNRVLDCGQTVRRILHGLPKDLLREGRWKVSFANVPGENSTRRYGFYGFRGVDTIGHYGITTALQLIYRNKLLTGEIVEPQQLLARCITGQETGQLCVLVHSDGRVERLPPSAAQLGSRRVAGLVQY